MNGKLILHIGPPKTGTTSLQYFFGTLSHPLIGYGGVIQPRSCNESSLVYELEKYCRDEIGKINSTPESIAHQISNELQKFPIVLLSEEAFLVHKNNLNVYDKLRVLYSVISQFDPLVLLTVRNPSDAIPSYYQEIYDSLPKKLQLDFAAFENSTYADCFRYRKLIEQLQMIGFRQFHCIDFENLICGTYSIAQLLNISGTSDLDDSVIMKKTNVGNSRNGKRKLVRRNRVERYLAAISRFVPGRLRGKGLTRRLINLGRQITSKSVCLQISAETIAGFQEDIRFLRDSQPNTICVTDFASPPTFSPDNEESN